MVVEEPQRREVLVMDDQLDMLVLTIPKDDSDWKITLTINGRTIILSAHEWNNIIELARIGNAVRKESSASRH